MKKCVFHSIPEISDFLRTAGARDFPPLLIFHWEAGADVLLDDLDGGAVANATPFLHQMLSRPDVFAGSAIASVPVTLKTAWEAGPCRGMAGYGCMGRQ